MTLCRNPYTQGMHVYGCGRCMPCRIQKRRIWEHRIQLEASLKSDNAFCTLTYRDEALPRSGSGLSTLEPKHLQDWLKRLRTAFSSSVASSLGTHGTAMNRLRFYAVGEYGDETFRPHYHAALFGLPTCSRLGLPVRTGGCPCAYCDLVRTTWGHGQVHLGTLEPASARYLAGYIEKKMTRNDDPRLLDRHPEFSRMSLRPGIGADFMHEVASTVLQFDLDAAQGDVPSSLRHGSRTLPLGRYLTRRLRTLTGKEANAPQETLQAREQEMRALYEDTRGDPKKINPVAPLLFKETLVNQNAAKACSQAARWKIRKPRKRL